MSQGIRVHKPGAKCDFCKEVGLDRPATVDGKVVIGTFWANMCDQHHAAYGLRGPNGELFFGVGIAQHIIQD